MREVILTKIIEKQEKDKNKFTRFWDMHSGGQQKLQWSKIYVNLPEDEAKAWFYKKFGRDCEHITCSCCSEDYSVQSAETIEVLTEFFRKDFNGNEKITLEEYLNSEDVLYVEITE